MAERGHGLGNISLCTRPVLGSGGASLAKRPQLEWGTETYPGGKKSAGGVSANSADARKKGPVGVSAPDVSQFTASSSLSSFFRLVCFLIFWISGEALFLTSLCLIWFRVTIFSLGHAPPLLCNCWQLNEKVAATHLPIIQKEVDELLSKGVIEPCSGGAGFYSSVFVVPKCMGGLWPIINLK